MSRKCVCVSRLCYINIHLSWPIVKRYYDIYNVTVTVAEKYWQLEMHYCHFIILFFLSAFILNNYYLLLLINYYLLLLIINTYYDIRVCNFYFCDLFLSGNIVRLKKSSNNRIKGRAAKKSTQIRITLSIFAGKDGVKGKDRNKWRKWRRNVVKAVIQTQITLDSIPILGTMRGEPCRK